MLIPVSLSKSNDNWESLNSSQIGCPLRFPKPAHCRQVETFDRFHLPLCRILTSNFEVLEDSFLKIIRHSTRFLVGSGVVGGTRLSSTGNGSFVTPLWGKLRKNCSWRLTLPSRPSSLNFGHLRHYSRISPNHQIPSIPLLMPCFCSRRDGDSWRKLKVNRIKSKWCIKLIQMDG